MAFPHSYLTIAKTNLPESTSLSCESEGLDSFDVCPPPQFNGPEGFWSPETLLSASVSTCYILTFRALAAAKKFDFDNLHCECDAILDKTSEGLRFTRYNISAELTISHDDLELAESLLQRAETNCLVSASLSGSKQLTTKIVKSA